MDTTPRRPVVGVSCYVEQVRFGAWDVPAAVLFEGYLQSVRDGGGEPVLLAPGTDALVLDRLDGLVLAGGPDIDPDRYGAAPDPTTDLPRTSRDGSELALCAGARDRGLPVLGICRGLQVMAVASGGSLLQDLPIAGYGATHRRAPGTYSEHGATFTDGSLVARVLGVTEGTVNSSHHQAVSDPGSLTVTGRAADGTIEVCEDRTAPFVLGVQWHPEATNPGSYDKALFRAFADACLLRT